MDATKMADVGNWRSQINFFSKSRQQNRKVARILIVQSERSKNEMFCFFLRKWQWLFLEIIL